MILLFDFHVHFWLVLVKKAHLKDLSEKRPHRQKTLRVRRTDTSSALRAPDGLILGHLLVHSVDKTYVLVLTVEWIWLLLLNILSFNFFLRLPAAVLSKQWQSYTAFLLEVATFLFFPAVSSNNSAFICLFYFCSSNIVNSKMGKQAKRCEIVIHKYMKTESWSRSSTEQRFSANLHLAEEANCFTFFAPWYGLNATTS